MRESRKNGWTKGALLVSVAMVCVVAWGTHDAGAQSIVLESVRFESTVIIEFESKDGDEPVERFLLELEGDAKFKSFKTESGWTATKSPRGELVFVAATPMMPGEIVKFGIKASEEDPVIVWRALNEDGGIIGSGLDRAVDDEVDPPVEVVDPPETVDPPDNTNDPPEVPTGPPVTERSSGVLPESSFRIIPENPNAGGTVRVVGEKFGANHHLDLYLNDDILETIRTDGSGNFVVTSIIPGEYGAGRMGFTVIDLDKNERAFSIRIGEVPDKVRTVEEIGLEINEIASPAYRGESVIFEGDGNPGGSVVVTIDDPDGNTVTTKSAQIGLDGGWSHETLVAVDAKFGEYSVTIQDGRNSITESWTVESGQKISLNPTVPRFNLGDVMAFNGTATPNTDLSVTIENPNGVEVFYDTIRVGPAGKVLIEYDTTFSDIEGTYVLFAFQEDATAIALAGLGENPQEQLIVKPDKINYNARDTAHLVIEGPPLATVSLLILDSSDRTKITNSTTIGPDGRKNYELDLSDFRSGPYTIVLTRGNAQYESVFSVGLSTGSGPIKIQTTKSEYLPGESILILGETEDSILMTFTLMDPAGEIVRVIESFTNKEGLISLDTFRVPSDAAVGEWKISAKSGSTFDDAIFTVRPSLEEGITLKIVSIEESPDGSIVTIQGFGVLKSTKVTLQVTADDRSLVGDLVEAQANKEGEYLALWRAPKDLPPGTYTVTVTDTYGNSRSEVFNLE